VSGDGPQQPRRGGLCREPAEMMTRRIREAYGGFPHDAGIQRASERMTADSQPLPLPAPGRDSRWHVSPQASTAGVPARRHNLQSAGS